MLSRRRALTLAATLLVGASGAVRAEPDDPIQLLKAGRLDDAQRLAELRFAADAGDSQARLLAGALIFARGAYAQARQWFDRDFFTGPYLAGSPASSNADILRTNFSREVWLFVASHRAQVPIANVLALPLLSLALGHLSVDEYAAQQAIHERMMYDGMVLSFTDSPGRQSLLNTMAANSEREHRCTGNLLLAELALARADTVAARTLLAAATQYPQPELLEYYVASAELARLG